MACAVSAMTGMALVAGSAFSRRVASQPSITGRLMSIRIRSGFSLAAMSTPCLAVDRDHDFEAVAHKPARQHVPVHLVVFDQKDFRHWSASV